VVKRPPPKFDHDDEMHTWIGAQLAGHVFGWLPEWEDEIVPTTPARRGAGGRPRMGIEELTNRYPIHNAALVFPVIKKKLQQAFPDKTTRAIHNRALELAVRMAKLKGGKHGPVVKLQEYLERPANDRRRIDLKIGRP
jgi:hypothetical protein